MSMYEIEIEEILSKTISINADSHEEAIKKAKMLYDNSEIILSANDFLEVNFKDLSSIDGGEIITKERGCMIYVKREPYIYIRNNDGKIVTRKVISVDTKNEKAKIRLNNKVVYVKYFCR